MPTVFAIARVAKGLRQDRLAKRIGLGEYALNRIERGHLLPTHDEAERILHELGLTGVELSVLPAVALRDAQPARQEISLEQAWEALCIVAAWGRQGGALEPERAGKRKR